MKIAGAPISWGVCEVPDWGYQMTPERVLTEMKQIGLTATEFGPQGWLPVDAEERAAVVGKFGLKPVGSFFLAVMHDPGFDPIPQVDAELTAFEVAGGEARRPPAVLLRLPTLRPCWSASAAWCRAAWASSRGLDHSQETARGRW